MASLYELDKGIEELLEHEFNEACVDEETGEIDGEKASAFLDQLLLDRTLKIESIALFIKNLKTDAVAIKTEEARLKTRREQKERKAERLLEYLKHSLLAVGDTKFETPRVALGFRSSKQVIVEDFSLLDKRFLTEKVEVAPNKTAIKQAIEGGEEVAGARIETKQNLMMK